MSKTKKQTFGDRIKIEMPKVGINQNDLGTHLKKSQSAISIMLSKENPSLKLEDLQKLHQIGFDIQWLILGNIEENVPANISTEMTQKIYTLQGKYIKCLEEKEILRGQVDFLEKKIEEGKED